MTQYVQGKNNYWMSLVDGSGPYVLSPGGVYALEGIQGSTITASGPGFFLQNDGFWYNLADSSGPYVRLSATTYAMANTSGSLSYNPTTGVISAGGSGLLISVASSGDTTGATDTKNIQAALNYGAPTIGLNGSQYYVNQSLLIGSNTSLLVGAGTQMTLVNGVNVPFLMTTSVLGSSYRTVVDAAIPATSTSLTSASAQFTAADVGKRVIVQYAGPAAFSGSFYLTAIIVSVLGNVATLSKAASTTVAAAGWCCIQAASSNYGIIDGSITSGTAVLTSGNNAPFSAADVGRNILVRGAGAGGTDLSTTILSYTSASSVTLATNALTTVTTQYFSVGTRVTGVTVQGGIWNRQANSGNDTLYTRCSIIFARADNVFISRTQHTGTAGKYSVFGFDCGSCDIADTYLNGYPSDGPHFNAPTNNCRILGVRGPGVTGTNDCGDDASTFLEEEPYGQYTTSRGRNYGAVIRDVSATSATGQVKVNVSGNVTNGPTGSTIIVDNISGSANIVGESANGGTLESISSTNQNGQMLFGAFGETFTVTNVRSSGQKYYPPASSLGMVEFRTTVTASYVSIDSYYLNGGSTYTQSCVLRGTSCTLGDIALSNGTAVGGGSSDVRTVSLHNTAAITGDLKCVDCVQSSPGTGAFVNVTASTCVGPPQSTFTGINLNASVFFITQETSGALMTNTFNGCNDTTSYGSYGGGRPILNIVNGGTGPTTPPFAVTAVRWQTLTQALNTARITPAANDFVKSDGTTIAAGLYRYSGSAWNAFN